MNPFSLASIAASTLGLVLSIWLLVANGASQSLQSELQTKQQELQNQNELVQKQQRVLQGQGEQIQSANVLSQQVGPQVLQDLANRAVKNKNEKVRGLLERYNLKIKDPADAAATKSPTP